MTTLKELLADWTDFDSAGHAVAVCFGMMPAEWEWVLRNAKWIFWTSNPIGNLLHDVLEDLVEQKVLEKNDDDQYRYNAGFLPPWKAE